MSGKAEGDYVDEEILPAVIIIINLWADYNYGYSW